MGLWVLGCSVGEIPFYQKTMNGSRVGTRDALQRLVASRCPILRLWGVWKLLLLDLGRVGVAREVESLDERFPASPAQLDF